MRKLVAVALGLFVLFSFSSAYATITKSTHVKHTKSAHVKHTKNNKNLTKNSSTFTYSNNNLIYDSVLDITWYNPNVGPMNWYDAMKWAEDLVIGDATDWRLPTALNADGSAPSSGYNQIGSELGHLYYESLGNTAYGPLTNTGPFTNLQPVNYWTNTESAKFAGNAWAFSFSTGLQGFADKNLVTNYSALAVHSGNIGATQIPEPGVIFLFALSLVGFAIIRKKFISR